MNAPSSSLFRWSCSYEKLQASHITPVYQSRSVITCRLVRIICVLTVQTEYFTMHSSSTCMLNHQGHSDTGYQCIKHGAEWDQDSAIQWHLNVLCRFLPLVSSICHILKAVCPSVCLSNVSRAWALTLWRHWTFLRENNPISEALEVIAPAN